MEARPMQKASEPSVTSTLIDSSRVQGTDVYDPAGKHIGSIKRLVLDKLSGRVVYTVASFGGFFGMGGDEYTIPWNRLNYDTNLGGFVHRNHRSAVARIAGFRAQQRRRLVRSRLRRGTQRLLPITVLLDALRSHWRRTPQGSPPRMPKQGKCASPCGRSPSNRIRMRPRPSGARAASPTIRPTCGCCAGG